MTLPPANRGAGAKPTHPVLATTQLQRTGGRGVDCASLLAPCLGQACLPCPAGPPTPSLLTPATPPRRRRAPSHPRSAKTPELQGSVPARVEVPVDGKHQNADRPSSAYSIRRKQASGSMKAQASLRTPKPPPTQLAPQSASPVGAPPPAQNLQAIGINRLLTTGALPLVHRVRERHPVPMNLRNQSSGKQWHHKPPHLFAPGATFMVTAGTWQKKHFFRTNALLERLQNTLFSTLGAQGWALQAWAIFPNHYHFIAQAPSVECPLKQTIQSLHSYTARELNRVNQTPGRRIWFQYWDTCITFERSYFARLNYVNQNPVKHGIVADAREYPFCSAAWFAESADPGLSRKVASFAVDQLDIVDDFNLS